MVCGVGREPAQWVKAPAPAQGKISHMKGAASQFWLPEILGSSPRLEQDNEIARALHAAMKVGLPMCVELVSKDGSDGFRLAFLMMSRFALAVLSHTAYIILSFCNKTRLTRYMGLLYVSGLEWMKKEPRPFVIFADERNRITMTRRKKRIGYPTVSVSFRDIRFMTC